MAWIGDYYYYTGADVRDITDGKGLSVRHGWKMAEENRDDRIAVKWACETLNKKYAWLTDVDCGQLADYLNGGGK